MMLVGAALLAMPVHGAAQDAAAVAEGATIWAQNCTRCHNARPSTERTDRDWLTIVAHMRARANLTRGEAAAVSAFLTGTNGPASGVSTGPEAKAAAETPREEEGMGVAGASNRTVGVLSLTPEQRELLLAYLRLLRPR